MKSIYFVSLAFLVFVFGCSKRPISGQPLNNDILGKWTWVENFYSIGGPGQWHPVTPVSQTIEFKPDGSFVCPNSFLNGASGMNLLTASQ